MRRADANASPAARSEAARPAVARRPPEIGPDGIVPDQKASSAPARTTVPGCSCVG
jgi:hypothetical protein